VFERVIAAVQQEQINAIELQATEAGFAFPLNGSGIQGPWIFLIWHGVFSELGCHHNTFSTTLQGLTQDALAQTLSVVICCVEKCHALIDSRLDLPNSIPFRLRDIRGS